MSIVDRNFIVDAHTHPALKSYLFDSDLSVRNTARPEFTLLGLADVYTDLPKLADGNIDVVMSGYYLPEQGLLSNSPLISNIARGILRPTIQCLLDKTEPGSLPNQAFEITQQMMSNFQARLEKANQDLHNRQKAHPSTNPNAIPPKDTIIARTFAELETSLRQGKRVVLQTLEGGHHLGRGLASTQEYLTRLNYFHQEGICMMTLGHFFANDVTTSCDGMPPSLMKTLGYKPKSTKELQHGLQTHGAAIVQEMFRIGMIVDLMHCTPKARQQIFTLNNNRTPLVFSHSGVVAKHNAPLNPSDGEIKQIQDCCGVIGVIFNKYWLTGDEESEFLGLDFAEDPCIDDIVQTMKHIQSITGNCDNIALGTDYDGFTDTPDDLKDISFMPILQKRLHQEFSQEDVRKIMGGNILRVLKQGWKEPLRPIA